MSFGNLTPRRKARHDVRWYAKENRGERFVLFQPDCKCDSTAAAMPLELGTCDPEGIVRETIVAGSIERPLTTNVQLWQSATLAGIAVCRLNINAVYDREPTGLCANGSTLGKCFETLDSEKRLCIHRKLMPPKVRLHH